MSLSQAISPVGAQPKRMILSGLAMERNPSQDPCDQRIVDPSCPLRVCHDDLVSTGHATANRERSQEWERDLGKGRLAVSDNRPVEERVAQI